MRIPRRVPAGAALLLLCVVSGGCFGSGNGVPIKGRVVKDGQPVRMPQGDVLLLNFVSRGDGPRIRTVVVVRQDGTFESNGPTQEGLPKGMQNVEVYPTSAELPPYNDRVFNGEFRGESTPLKIELTEANCQNILVDLSSKTVKAE